MRVMDAVQEIVEVDLWFCSVVALCIQKRTANVLASDTSGAGTLKLGNDSPSEAGALREMVSTLFARWSPGNCSLDAPLMSRGKYSTAE